MSLTRSFLTTLYAAVVWGVFYLLFGASNIYPLLASAFGFFAGFVALYPYQRPNVYGRCAAVVVISTVTTLVLLGGFDVLAGIGLTIIWSTGHMFFGAARPEDMQGAKALTMLFSAVSITMYAPVALRWFVENWWYWFNTIRMSDDAKRVKN